MAETTKNGISRSDLNTVMKDLPAPVREHSLRCKHLCDYLLERARGEDWFLDSGLTEDAIRTAIYYHDVGKAAIPLDDIQAEFAKTAAHRSSYRRHPEEGVALIEKKFSVVLISQPDGSLEKEIYHAIMEHHEFLDGSGFPKGLDIDSLSLTGRICAIVDNFDGTLVATDFDTAAAIEKLQQLSGRYLDEDIIATFLGSPETLTDFVDGLARNRNRRHQRDRYGMQLMFDPVYDIVDTNEYRKKIVAYRCEMWINDPYFGMIGPGVYTVAAEKTGQIYRLETLVLDKVVRMLQDMRDEGCEPRVPILIPTSFLEVSNPQEPVKKKSSAKKTKRPSREAGEGEAPGVNRFLEHLKANLKSHEIGFGKIILGLNEADIVNSNFDIGLIQNDFHGAGVAFAIENFAGAATLIPSLDKSTVDYILMNADLPAKMNGSSKSFSMVQGLVTTLRSLDQEPIFRNISTMEERAKVIKAGGKLGTAPLWGAPMTQKEFIGFIKENNSGGTEK